MSQILGAFGLLDFTVLLGAFLNLWTVYLFKFPIFFSDRGQPRILNREYGSPPVCVCVCVYVCMYVYTNIYI